MLPIFEMNFGSSTLHKAGTDAELPEGEPSSSASESFSLNINGLTDAELVQRLRDTSSPESIAVLFTRYRPLILSICLKILQDPFEAEDVCQDVILAIWGKADQFDEKRGTVKVWIVQLAYSKSLHRRRHLAIRHFNGHAKNGNGDGRGHVENLELSYVPELVERLTVERQLSEMTNAFASLPPKQQKALRLICFEGLSIREVAEQTSESVENTRHYYYRGLKKLKEILTQSSVEKVR